MKQLMFDTGFQNSLSFYLGSGQNKINVHFRSKEATLYPNSESIIAASLSSNMIFDEPVKAQNHQTDELFLSSLNQIQDVFKGWNPRYSNIQIQSESTKDIPTYIFFKTHQYY